VIERIYTGPHLPVVPRTFISHRQQFPQALAQLGFIVFVVDGRGTPKRGKEFQDVVKTRQQIKNKTATFHRLKT